ncbi:MAG: 16S rRNA (cytidine(1402)-2'-O)-methyltransferase [Candidatus Berkelbacteria bacterium]|nr:16S rRNA (cytidine(1402)-2'-O)-methyltransferase [Candidatus Berkelbacteria bacterium]
MKQGILYIVATPIGNLGDITKRAIEILSAVDFVVCEDTRVAGGLLHHMGIKKELISLHRHSSEEKIEMVIRRISDGENAAYVSDNGTPGISDPGQKLIQKSKIKSQNDGNEIQIIPIPGPSALTAAVSVSGIVDKEFYFAGFLPKKKGRQTKLKELSALKCPVVIYESAQRIERTLKDISVFFAADTEIFIAREMTKKFEEYWSGKIADIISGLKNHKIKGEFVVIIKNSKLRSQNVIEN